MSWYGVARPVAVNGFAGTTSAQLGLGSAGAGAAAFVAASTAPAPPTTTSGTATAAASRTCRRGRPVRLVVRVCWRGGIVASLRDRGVEDHVVGHLLEEG